MRKPKIRVSFIRHSVSNYYIIRHKMLWKDKDGRPYLLLHPSIIIRLFKFELWFVRGNTLEWEEWLWLHKYNGGDKVKAKITWPW